MWSDITLMFNTMQWYIYIPLIIGVLLMVLECFIPGFGIAGISGLTCIIGAITAQGILYKSVAQILFLISLTIFTIFLLFLIFLRSARYGLIGKSPLIQNKTALPTDYKQKNELSNLIGQKGITVNSLKPSGKFMIGEKVYQGITSGEPIDKDEIIKVVDVQGIKIIVEKMEV